MKKILTGMDETVDAKKLILQTILNHTGKIIFISAKDKFDYFKIDDFFVRKDIYDDEDPSMKSGYFNDYIINNLVNQINENKHIFFQCESPHKCHIIGRLLTKKSILDDENTLLIIDEGGYIFPNIAWDMFKEITDKKSDILLTFFSESLTKENYEKEKTKFFNLPKWDITYYQS